MLVIAMNTSLRQGPMCDLVRQRKPSFVNSQTRPLYLSYPSLEPVSTLQQWTFRQPVMPMSTLLAWHIALTITGQATIIAVGLHIVSRWLVSAY